MFSINILNYYLATQSEFLQSNAMDILTVVLSELKKLSKNIQHTHAGKTDNDLLVSYKMGYVTIYTLEVKYTVQR